MGQHLIGIYGLLIGAGLTLQSIHADDRKSAGSVQDRREATLSAEKRGAVVAQPEKVSVLVIKPLPDRRSGGSDEQAHRDKSLTLFRFKSSLGEVAVKPVFGHVTGAEFSIDF